jgi:hypothetical protein
VAVQRGMCLQCIFAFDAQVLLISSLGRRDLAVHVKGARRQLCPLEGTCPFPCSCKSPWFPCLFPTFPLPDRSPVHVAGAPTDPHSTDPFFHQTWFPC